MATIVPRWEWRTFGPRFAAAEAAFAALTPGGVQDSDELYLLSTGGDNVKVRDDLMDIKVLRETDPNGLQRWEPVLKTGFPLAAVDVGRVFDALRLPMPDLAHAAYSLEQFVGELAVPSGGLRAIEVHKHRVRYTVGGCMAEVSDIEAAGRRVKTIAIESEDRGAVIAAVRGVGLGGYVNTSYPSGLAALIEDRPARYAVIDAGTNSIKFHIGERAADGTWRPVVDRAEVTRLGQDLEQRGSIAPEALERTIDAIAGMVEEAKAAGVLAIAAAGTAGLRVATDSAAAIEAIRARTGVEIEVISGEEESRLAYVATMAGLGMAEGSLAVFDTGGGSTQFTFGHGRTVDERFSVPVGAVRYTERFELGRVVSSDRLHEAMAAMAEDLARIDDRPKPDALVGMGGAITNITAVKHGLAVYDPDVVQGTVLDRAEIERQIELYRSQDAEARRSIVGLQPKRADVILAGACIIHTVMDKLGQDRLTVSDRGLRHGLLVERFGAGEGDDA
jgi:exopolyphosphatase/guanosine-5'-triphosphate,3'-diphosphate pyrophosphatase